MDLTARRRALTLKMTGKRFGVAMMTAATGRDIYRQY
jgi:hypothetical protein